MRPAMPRMGMWMVALCLVGLVSGAFIVPLVMAQTTTPSTNTFQPFTLYPAGPGAIPFDQLSDIPADPLPLNMSGPPSTAQVLAASREPKAAVQMTQNWVESSNGYAVGQAWSAYSNLMVQQAQTKQAENAAGLSGISEVGVVP